jgi:hypothetical protein
MRIPKALTDEWQHEPDWLGDLPRLAAECAAMWGLELEEPIETPHSLVVPAGTAVLKLTHRRTSRPITRRKPSHAGRERERSGCWPGMISVARS